MIAKIDEIQLQDVKVMLFNLLHYDLWFPKHLLLLETL
jgi:hypothetical protein